MESEKRNEHWSLTGGICQIFAVYDLFLKKGDSDTNILNSLSYLTALPRYLLADFVIDQPALPINEQ